MLRSIAAGPDPECRGQGARRQVRTSGQARRHASAVQPDRPLHLRVDVRGVFPERPRGRRLRSGVISTKVGGCENLITENHNGYFIRRDREQISSVYADWSRTGNSFRTLGENNRAVVEERYSWDVR